MKRLSLFAILAAATVLNAQSDSCPVKITDVRNVNGKLSVLFQNTSNASLSSYQFELIFIDLAGRQHPFPSKVNGSAAVAPGAEHLLSMEASDALHFLFPKANAYLVAGTFSDGTTWSDDGSRQCGYTSWQE